MKYWETAWLGKCLLCKPQELSSHPGTQTKGWAWCLVSVVLMLRRHTEGSLGLAGSASLDKAMNYRFMERSCLKKQVEDTH